MLLAAVDMMVDNHLQFDFPEDTPAFLGALKQNRNRIARLLNLPTRDFKKGSAQHD